MLMKARFKTKAGGIVVVNPNSVVALHKSGISEDTVFVHVDGGPGFHIMGTLDEVEATLDAAMRAGGLADDCNRSNGNTDNHSDTNVSS